MDSQNIISLPPIAPFPEAAWRARIVPEEWAACLDAWILLVKAHLFFALPEFERISAKDESVTIFLLSYMSETAASHDLTPFVGSSSWKVLRKLCFLLSNRLFHVENPPGDAFKWEFLSDFCKVYGKALAIKPISNLWVKFRSDMERNLGILKTALIGLLEVGVKGSPADLERDLKLLNYLIYSSPDAATFFMSGSDFLDGLVSCYKLMNPPLRRAIISTTYLLLLGLTEGTSPKFSLLTDLLYSLHAAAESHKAGPMNVNDSLVAELVTATPFLKHLQDRADNNHVSSSRAKSIISSLESFRKAEGGRSKRLIKRKVDKGKARAILRDDHAHGGPCEMHIHCMSLVTQVQDLFPDLGSRFIMKLLDEYNEDVEQVVSHLLEDSLPVHLRDADRGEVFSREDQIPGETLPNFTRLPTSPLPPIRRNIFDDDEFDQLTLGTSRLHFGRRNPDKTADDILRDRSSAPQKSAILAALATFDSDDDERDDTYDVEDVGGTVDSVIAAHNPEEPSNDISGFTEESLFRAFKTTPSVFDRNATTRKSKPRIALREETGMTDEAVEGWALMLSRDARRMRRLEASFSSFSGRQEGLAPTAWRADAVGSGSEESDHGAQASRGANRSFRGRSGRGQGGPRRGGNLVGPRGEKDTEAVRQRKEANKGSRANHNRRDQRARKMARGGFPS